MDTISTDLQFHDSELGLKELFTFAYTTNCELESESLTEEERQTLDELDALEVLENFKDLVVDLLNFKKDFRSSEKSELAQRSEQFEAMLQKLESEVRNHIRVEQQLKLHLESAQSRVEELEKQSDSKLVQSLREAVLAKDREIDDLRSTFEEKQKRHHERTPSLEEKPKKPVVVKPQKEKVGKLEMQCEQLKALLREKHSEVEAVRREYQALAQEFGAYKERTKLRGTASHRKEDLVDARIREDSLRRTDASSPYKEKTEPVYIRTVYQTYITNDSARPAKRHTRTGSDRLWRPSSSSGRSRPVSSLKV